MIPGKNKSLVNLPYSYINNDDNNYDNMKNNRSSLLL